MKRRVAWVGDDFDIRINRNQDKVNDLTYLRYRSHNPTFKHAEYGGLTAIVKQADRKILKADKGMDLIIDPHGIPGVKS